MQQAVPLPSGEPMSSWVIQQAIMNGGAIFAVSNISLSFTGISSFSSNSAMQGGAIAANSNSTLTFNGSVNFTSNGCNMGDSHGGAMYLAISSIFPNTTECWENNCANLGGAIYVLNANPLTYCKMTQFSTFLEKDKCFFQLPGQNAVDYFVLKNNSADAAGSVLYGGAIDD